MTWLYAGSLVVGMVALIVLVVIVGLSERGDRMVARRVVAGLTAFGIAGMSATFGGWSPVLAAVGAIVAAVAAVVYASSVGVE